MRPGRGGFAEGNVLRGRNFYRTAGLRFARQRLAQAKLGQTILIIGSGISGLLHLIAARHAAPEKFSLRNITITA